ncbi:MAG: ECF-type sigma factor [Planctomycetes bacterium]|nr:ECF-type sigma factor [Planctomycetota bacterium]
MPPPSPAPQPPAPQSTETLLTQLYAQLRAEAQKQMARERASHTLTATALVHEAWLRIAGPREIPFENRPHMYKAAVEAMRHVLLDHAKTRGRKKRGGGKRTNQSIDLDAPLDVASDDKLDDFLLVDEAIERLRAKDPRAAEIVRLRILGGISVAETAALLGISERTVKTDWAFARAWLARDLAKQDGEQ